MRYLLGIDIGTSGTKTVLFDEELRIISSFTGEYSLSTPKPLYAEQNADDWWTATLSGICGVIKQSGIDPKAIVGIGLSGQMHGLVMLGEKGELLRPSIIWCDQRTASECEQITSLVGRERLIELTANPALTGFTASKILWVRNNEPDIYAKCKHILLPKDYIRYKLAGVFATEVSDASGMQLLNVAERKWSGEVLDKLGIDVNLLCKVYESEEVTGRITAEISALTGLSAGTVVVGGAGDQAASAIGNGIVKEGIISDTLGSSGVVFALTNTPKIDPKGRVHTFCHAVRGKWHIMGVTQGCGISVKWFKDNCCRDAIEEAKISGIDPYVILDKRAEGVAEGSDGVIFLPYLMGERTPHLDPKAKGIFFGLTGMTDSAAMYRSVLEGVCFSQRDCLDIIRELGVQASEIRVSGGGAKSKVWNEILANILECPLVKVNNSESGALGVAILAGVGAGVFDSVAATADKYIKTKDRVEITGSNLKDNYDKYGRLYELLKGEF